MPELADLVVVGSGAAGLMAAVTASPHVDTLVVSDGPLGRSNSVMAQGGLQLPYPSPESERSLVLDMERSGRVELDRARVLAFVPRIRTTVAALEALGLELDREPDGTLHRSLAGGLSEPRVVSATDRIGPAVMRVLMSALEARPARTMLHTTVETIEPEEGAVVLRGAAPDGALVELHARAVVCATGGTTFRVAKEQGETTTNPANSNHVLYDALGALGLPQMHGDLFQRQPFGLVEEHAGRPGRCVPERIVTFPVRLLDRHGREVCSVRDDRLTITGAILDAVARGDGVPTAAGEGVLLTLSAVGPDALAREFPTLARHLRRQGRLGADVVVRPFLHYQLGGYRIRTDCSTIVPGLYLAGELTGGIHGRNRLMGNGITDALVHGQIAGESAVRLIRGTLSPG